MIYECPKCGKYGLEWDGRAKAMICHFSKCQLVIHMPNQKEVPSHEEILDIVENERSHIEKERDSIRLQDVDFMESVSKISRVLKELDPNDPLDWDEYKEGLYEWIERVFKELDIERKRDGMSLYSVVSDFKDYLVQNRSKI